MSNPQHSPTPWHQSRSENQREFIYSDAHRRPVAVCGSLDTWQEMDANAAHIVKCVNAHDALVEAGKRLANAVLAWRTNGKPDLDWPRKAQEEMHAALHLAHQPKE